MNKNLKDYLEGSLGSLEEFGLKRKLRNVESAQKSLFQFEGREILNFCSNNYLGLADDEQIKQAAIDSIKEDGFGSGAARLVCGNMEQHRKLEAKLADFKKTESSLIFSSGYMANVGIISSLFDKDDMIFWDRLNHASIIDGILLSKANHKRYPHNDMNALEKLMKEESGFKKRVVITDSIFSMDGDIAPLDKIVKLAKKYDCIVMVDEAHALGVMGKNGKGCVEHFGLENDIDIQMGTLSKACGSFGAYVCGSKDLMEFLINKARSFIYTTGLPPSVAAASCKAIEFIEQDKERRNKLWENARYMGAQLKLMGFDTMVSETPIIPILVKDPNLAVGFSQRLFEKGIFVSAIRPPTVPPKTARLRLTVMATHKKKDLDFALNLLEKIGREMNII